MEDYILVGGQPESATAHFATNSSYKTRTIRDLGGSRPSTQGRPIKITGVSNNGKAMVLALETKPGLIDDRTMTCEDWQRARVFFLAELCK